MTLFEFWPDYGQGPLWTKEGKPADLGALPLGDDLLRSLMDWNAQYAENRLPVEGPGDVSWLGEGKVLLHRVRQALGPGHEVVVTEPWWGE